MNSDDLIEYFGLVNNYKTGNINNLKYINMIVNRINYNINKKNYY